jgi:hypothetical protein
MPSRAGRRGWSAVGQAGGRRGVPAREYCPAGAPWCGRRLDRHGEGVATYRDGLAGDGPAGSRPSPAARSADCPLSARRASGPVPGTEARDGQQNWQCRDRTYLAILLIVGHMGEAGAGWAAPRFPDR